MSSNLRVIVDTNVLISGLFGISDSPSSHILRAIRNQQIILVSSALILEEIQEVLNRKRIVKRTKMSAKERQQFIDDLTKRSYVTVSEQLSTLISRDVADDKFLACAYESKADYLITGDEDLLIIGSYDSTKIITPREFVELGAISPMH